MREKRDALLMAVMQNVIEMHTTSTINLSEMREVMAGIRRRETEEMRTLFMHRVKTTTGFESSQKC